METNFNADDYTVEELENIFELEKPYTKKELDDVANNYIEKYMNKNHRDYVLFFQRAKFILEAEITETKEKYKISETNTQVSKNEMEKYNIIDRSKLLSVNNPVKIGTLNQTEHSVMTQIVNIDSQYRRIFDNSGVLCTNGNGIDIGPGDSQYVNTSSDFIIDLSEPLTNVLEMSLHSIELPHSWYTFSSDYGTNSFVIERVDRIGMHQNHNPNNYVHNGTYGTYTLIIPDGNYTPSELVNTINGIFQQDFTNTGGGTPINLSYNANTNKISFNVNWTFFKYSEWTSGDPDDSSQWINVKFYSNDLNSNCANNGRGGKIDYNLGWLMGFRKKEYRITAVPENDNTVIESITGESLVDTYGCRYVLLYVDEYVNNRVTQGLISLTNNKDKFELPDYFKKKNCQTEYLPGDTRLREGTNADATPQKNKLTQAQQYTVDQIKHAQNITNQDRYYSPTSSDILVRLPINKSTNYNVIIMTQNQIGENKREYFGPVRIRRLHIKLLNDKGIPLNLNDMNWSFALKIKYLYKY
tara:strand:- start:4822 stop:6402 length:1581 start_codon:yes stop_codon:yes gene_type:complete